MHKISILISDASHPINENLSVFSKKWSSLGYSVEIVNKVNQLTGGTFLFLVSCTEIIKENVKALYFLALVLHASDLPKGRGWSPHVWSIINGEKGITVSILEAESPVDSGKVWAKKYFSIEEHELLDEVNRKLFQAEIELMEHILWNFPKIEAIPQEGEVGVYLRKRTPADSELDLSRPLIEQINLLRAVDNIRYPAYFFYKGYKYILEIRKEES